MSGMTHGRSRHSLDLHGWASHSPRNVMGAQNVRAALEFPIHLLSELYVRIGREPCRLLRHGARTLA